MTSSPPPCTQAHTSRTTPCCQGCADPQQLHVVFATNEEISSPGIPALGQGGPHRFERLDVVLLIAATVRKKTESNIIEPTMMVVHLSATKVINLSWAKNGCSAVVTAMYKVFRKANCRGRPFVSLSKSVEKRKSCKMWCLCRKSSNHSQHLSLF